MPPPCSLGTRLGSWEDRRLGRGWGGDLLIPPPCLLLLSEAELGEAEGADPALAWGSTLRLELWWDPQFELSRGLPGKCWFLHLLRAPPEGQCRGLWVDENHSCAVRQALVSITPASYWSLPCARHFPRTSSCPLYFIVTYFIFCFFISLFRLWKYDNTFTGDLEKYRRKLHIVPLYTIIV